MFSLFLFLNLAFAEEPQFTTLQEGEVAPWTGRLFNDAAVAKFIVSDKYKIEQCNIEIEYAVSKKSIELDLDYQKKIIDLETQNKILNEKVLLRDERIKGLERLKTPPDPFWYVAGGFLVGAATTIGIAHAVN